MKRLISYLSVRRVMIGAAALALASALTYAGSASPDEMPCPKSYGDLCPP